MKKIDRKFEFVAINPCSGNHYTEEDAFVFCAKDRAAPAALKAYLSKCKALGCDKDQIKSVKLLIKRVKTYQKEVKAKAPDIDSLCESIRCLKEE